MFGAKAQIFAFIDAQRPQYGLERLCRLYRVSRAGYYAWRRRQPSMRARTDQVLREKIERVFADSGATYGSPRVQRQLQRDGVHVSRKRVARLMRVAGLRGRVGRLYWHHAASHAFFTDVPNRLRGQQPGSIDQHWVGDITYLKIGAHWRYLAVIMDRYSRRVLSWRLGRQRNVDLTLSALNGAVALRRPRSTVLFHSDRGIEYGAHAYRARLRQLGFEQSMNRPGKVGDNAHMESFFHSLKADLFHGIALRNEQQARRLLNVYIPYYNHIRLHSALNYFSPVEHESRS